MLSLRVCCDLYGSNQCDQIGRFLKVLGDYFSYKSGPNVC